MSESDAELLARVRLAAALPYRPRAARALVARFGTAVETLGRPPEDWASVAELSVEEASQFAEQGRRFDAEKEVREAERLGVRLLWPGRPGFPDSLEAIPDAPALLWVRGAWEDRPALAIVGTRRTSSYGRRMAARFGADAVGAGFAVVSGLARGVDTVAHEAALKAGGTTWAVLGSGLARCYPRENEQLLDRIVEKGGAAFSEHPLHTEPIPKHFPRRNRLVSGLAFGTLVIEGSIQSGALITAKCALDQGRDVFAVPGPADWELSRGPHLLIQQGAKLTQSIEDITAEATLFNLLPAPPRAETAAKPEPPPDEVLDALAPEPLGFDALVAQVGWEPARLSERLLDLELKGLVKSFPGRRYGRTYFDG